MGKDKPTSESEERNEEGEFDMNLKKIKENAEKKKKKNQEKQTTNMKQRGLRRDHASQENCDIDKHNSGQEKEGNDSFLLQNKSDKDNNKDVQLLREITKSVVDDVYHQKGDLFNMESSLDEEIKKKKINEDHFLKRNFNKIHSLSYIKNYDEEEENELKKELFGDNFKCDDKIIDVDREKEPYNSSQNNFYFMMNRSSICATDNKFLKHFEKYCERTHNSIGKKKIRIRKRKNILKEQGMNALSFENIKYLDEKRENKDVITEEKKKKNVHEEKVLYSLCDISSFVSDELGEKVEKCEEKESYASENSKCDDIDDYKQINYKMPPLSSASFLEDFDINHYKKEKEKSLENICIDELEKENCQTEHTSIPKQAETKKKTTFWKGTSVAKGKKKEKIIIFIDQNYGIWENGKFDDHFYKIIYKKDENELEEVEVYINDLKKNRIKRIIYGIFPQFSIHSLVLYISFIQWIIYILMISLKAHNNDFISMDSITELGNNYPMRVFKNREYYRLITSLFLHSNFNHICANTYVQLTVGFLLEYLYGTFWVFLIYMLTGVYGIILSSPLSYCESTTESSTPASGIIGMFFVEILIMTNFNVDKINISVNLASFYLLLFFLKFSLNTTSINLSAHVFGFIGGFLIGIILKYRQLKYFVKHNIIILLICILFFLSSLAFALLFTILYATCVS